MNESIYNLIPRDPVVEEKRRIPFTSKPAQTVVPYSTFGCTGTTRLLGAGKVNKKDGAMFGPPKPETGLRRSSNSGSRSPERNENKQNGHFAYTDRRKGSVPSKEERPIMGITTNKNFITANAVEAILMVPKKVGGKELDYTKKEDFGKVPAYLTQVKEEIRRENEMIERYIRQQMGEVEKTPESYEQMTQAERQELINQLKDKWDHTNSLYQKQTHLVKLDSQGQIRRKEQFEALLSQLERDIERLERASDVLIKN